MAYQFRMSIAIIAKKRKLNDELLTLFSGIFLSFKAYFSKYSQVPIFIECEKNIHFFNLQ